MPECLVHEADDEANREAAEVMRLRKREVARRKRLAKKEAKRKTTSCPLCEHNVFTHFPYDPTCEVCRSCRTHKAYCSQKCEPAPDALPEPKEFGDAITADHKILNDDTASSEGDKAACIIQDRATY